MVRNEGNLERKPRRCDRKSSWKREKAKENRLHDEKRKNQQMLIPDGKEKNQLIELMTSLWLPDS